MTWKAERWLADIFPGGQQIYSEYRLLPPRELVIVCGAVLDSALAELIVLRLKKNPKECDNFLGFNGDGRAPLASFGARIQLALLIGIITKDDASILREIKGLRNVFAHKVKVDFLSEGAQVHLRKIYNLWLLKSQLLIKNNDWNGNTNRLEEIGSMLNQISEAGEGLLLAVFTVYQAYFHRMSSQIIPISNAINSVQK